MMLNCRIVMGLVASSVCSGLSLGWAMPGMAQQVVLTPGGTMMQPLPAALPVGAVMMTSPVPGMEAGPVDETPFVWGAPGTGIDGNTVLKPEDKVAKNVVGIELEPDPDALIGGVGGVRYADLIKGDKPDPAPYSPEKIAELVRQGEYVYNTSSSQTFTPVSIDSALPQVESMVQSGTIVSTLPNGNNNITSPKLVNPSLLPTLTNSSDSPLSNSRVLPGFNQ
jgi:hypothetical protein